MIKITTALATAILTFNAAAQSVHIPKSMTEDKDKTMSEAYWNIWNPEVQARIDADIDRYRKADAEVYIPNAKKGTPVKVEQISSSFYFGSQIFNYEQLGSTELNNKYKDVFGTLFNSATVAIYWKEFEPEYGHPRFAEDENDTEEFWNNCPNPADQNGWRRPSTDKVIRFLKEKGLRIHGHCIMFPAEFSFPGWVWDVAVPQEEKEAFKYVKDNYDRLSEDSISILLPKTAANLDRLNEKRMKEIGEHYYDVVDSWDVTNETRIDYELGHLQNGLPLCKSLRFKFITPGDYVYKAFESAQRYFSPRTWLNINDNVATSHMSQNIEYYPLLVNSIRGRGCRVDVIGSQMHLFKPQECADIAAGARIQTPDTTYYWYNQLCMASVPMHLSEITITAPTPDAKGEMIQAIITRNLYRLWFSLERMTGITWWNLVDGCGYKGEPTTSGLFNRDMTPKTSYYALEELILHEWRTNLELKVGEGGKIFFRGFKGKYRISWNDGTGERERIVEVK